MHNRKSYHKSLFWLPIFISLITLIIVLYNPTSRESDKELKEYIKTYVDSINTVTQKDIDKASIEVFDRIYGDTTIARKSTSH